MPEWEEIDIPAGSFIGWGSKPGQHVTGRVIDYGPASGKDMKGNPCPEIGIELTEKAASFNKEGNRTDFEAGEMVNLTCGQLKLAKGIRAADPSPGDLVKVELIQVEKLANGNTLKHYSIKIARGTGAPTSKPAAVAAQDDDEPPF